jgi:hypothetical protein
MSTFIVIEKFDREWPAIACTEDGQPMLFETEEAAKDEAEDCQDGLVVCID